MKSTGKMGKKVVWEGVHSRFFWNKRIEGDRGSIVGVEEGILFQRRDEGE